MRHLHCARNTKRNNVSTKAMDLSLIFMLDCEWSDPVLTLSCLGLLNVIYILLSKKCHIYTETNTTWKDINLIYFAIYLYIFSSLYVSLSFLFVYHYLYNLYFFSISLSFLMYVRLYLYLYLYLFSFSIVISVSISSRHSLSLSLSLH